MTVGVENAKPGAQFVLERASDPRRHVFTLHVNPRGRIATVQEEADAGRQTVAAPFDHLSDTRFRARRHRIARTWKHRLMHFVRSAQ